MAYRGKEKEFHKLFPHLHGKRVRIWTSEMFKSHWAEATVNGFSGSYLGLIDVEIWNGDKKIVDSLHVRWITKIEVIDSKPNTEQ